MKIKFILWLSLLSQFGKSQDTIASGEYKIALSKNYDKVKTEKECIENAKLNAIENAYGFSISQVNESYVKQESNNNTTNFNSNFKSAVSTTISGRWVRDIEAPLVSYDNKEGFEWISVKVKGIVKELGKINFGYDRLALKEFAQSNYKTEPYDGVKIIENYNIKYLVSVITIEKDKYNSSSTMNRVAQVKSNSQVNTFINGAIISSEFIIKSDETKTNNKIKSEIKTSEIIKENANGFVNGMETLANFDSEAGKKKVYIYFRECN